MATPAPDTTQPIRAAKKAPMKPLTLKTLNAYINDVEKRLKQIDAVTLGHVEQLEASVEDIKNQFGQKPAEHYVQLSGRLDRLAREMTEGLNNTQADVAAGLAEAMRNPTLSNLQLAILQADRRIEDCETSQSAAITKINRHIADIATAVDAEFEKIHARQTQETSIREDAMSEMKRIQKNSQVHLERRLNQVEEESARAISSIGNKIIDMGRDMQDKVISSEKLIKNHVHESAQNSKAEFESVKKRLLARIEAVENANETLDTQFGRGLASLTSRVEDLEFGLASGAAQASVAASLAPTPEPVFNEANVGSQDFTVNADPDMHDLALDEPQPFPAVQELEPLPPVTHVQPVTPVPLSVGLAPYSESPSLEIQNDVSIPDPRVTPISRPSPYAPVPQALSVQQRDTSLDLQENLEPLPTFTDIDNLPIDMSDLPYADPAYAEADYADINRLVEGGVDAARPKGRHSKKGKVRNTSFKKVKPVKSKSATSSKPSKGSNALRLGALTLGTLALSYVVASQTILKSDETQISSEPRTPKQILAADASSSQTQVQTTAPAIGNYQDNKPVLIAANTPAAATLESAARDGNAIAQLQLGVSWYEAGQIEQGIDMIRQSANQDQPAALYRLAKLYENGEGGLTADSTTARKLTERAARGGNRIAMHDLGLYYAEGRGGVKVDMTAAAKWFEKAAQRGVVDSQYNLAILYESGQGLPTNTENSLVWYSIAARQGDQMAEQRASALAEQLGAIVAENAETRVKAFKPTHIDEAANGIFRDMPWSQSILSVNAVSTDPRLVVSRTQTMLNGLGYSVGAPDGQMGPKTRSAILAFERSTGLPETGEVNSALVEQLEAASGV